MFDNPSDEWQRLTQHYHEMFDGQLEELAADFKDLTPTAQEVLRNEMRNRGLGDPAEQKKRPDIARVPVSDQSRYVGIGVSPFGDITPPPEPDPDENAGGPRDYTWKTTLCDCEDNNHARMLQEVLRRAGIDSWIQLPQRYDITVQGPRISVAADQLEEAIAIAQEPIPNDVAEWANTPEPDEYVSPGCPACGAEDPVLESAEPTNSWLCEACGKRWTEPLPVPDGEAGKTGR